MPRFNYDHELSDEAPNGGVLAFHLSIDCGKRTRDDPDVNFYGCCDDWTATLEAVTVVDGGCDAKRVEVGDMEEADAHGYKSMWKAEEERVANELTELATKAYDEHYEG